MARSPSHRDVLTPEGVLRVPVRYVRPFRQTIRVGVCWLYASGVGHSCAEMACVDCRDEWRP